MALEQTRSKRFRKHHCANASVSVHEKALIMRETW